LVVVEPLVVHASEASHGQRLNQRQFKVARFFANSKNRDALNCPLDFFVSFFYPTT
jgi:hypothetical protein